MNDEFSHDDLEAQLRDVLAHQADSVDLDATAPVDSAHEGFDDIVVVPLFNEPTESSVRRRGRSRVVAATSAAVAVAAAIALIAMAMGPSTAPNTKLADKHHPKRVKSGDAGNVVAALAATTATGAFDATYRVNEAAGAPTTTTTICGNVFSPPAGQGGPAPTTQTTPLTLKNGERVSLPTSLLNPSDAIAYCRGGGSSAYVGPEINGHASVRVDPLLILSESEIGGSIGHVTVWANSDEAWETSGTTQSPSSQHDPLSSFTSVATGSLGQREGAVVITSLASPTGYLTLSKDAAEHAQSTGHETVDGVDLAMYDITLTPEQMAGVTGTSVEERKTLSDALDIMKSEGLVNTTVRIGIGADGLIHTMTSVTHFSDSGSVTFTVTFSNFGCDAQVMKDDASCQGAPNAPAPTNSTVPPTTPSSADPVTNTTALANTGPSVPPATSGASTSTTPAPSPTS